MTDDEILKEFQQPYNYMLYSKEENIDEEYRYRLLSNIFVDTTYSPKNNQKFLYLFGIFPCDNMPASYIPFNYKNYHKTLIEYLKITHLPTMIMKRFSLRWVIIKRNYRQN